MWRLADAAARRVPRRRAGASSSPSYAQPFAMLVVADLLGVPESDHQRFREGFGLSGTLGKVGAGEAGNPSENPLAWLDAVRSPSTSRTGGASPAGDVLTELALATYPDGSDPRRSPSVVRTATFLFAAGPGDDGAPARGRLEAPRRAPRAAGRAAGRTATLHPELPRGGAAGREPGEDRLPPRPALHDPRRRRHRRGDAGDAAERRREPRPAPLRVPARVPRRPAEPAGAHRVRARPPLLPRRSARPGRGPGQPRAHPRPDHATSGSPRSTTARPAPAASTTSRRGSSAASPSCTSSSTRRGQPVSRVAVVTGGASGIGLGVAQAQTPELASKQPRQAALVTQVRRVLLAEKVMGVDGGMYI